MDLKNQNQSSEGVWKEKEILMILITTILILVMLLVVVISHIQRIGDQPEKNNLHGGQFLSWSAEQEEKNKNRKSGSVPPTPPVMHRAVQMMNLKMGMALRPRIQQINIYSAF